MHLETSGGISPQSAYCLRIEASAVANGELAVANEGFFGIGVQKGVAYSLSLYTVAAISKDRSWSVSTTPTATPVRTRCESKIFPARGNALSAP